MSVDTAIATRGGTDLVHATSFTREQIELLKRTICKGATDDEFALFAHVAKRTGLDPFARQIHAVKRKEKDENGEWRDALTIQTGIDGYRLIAQRTGRYLGQTAPQWCDSAGQWYEVWTSEAPPNGARVGVHVAGAVEPTWGVALYREYVQRKRDGTPNRMWATMPAAMTAKCAEALALRKAFPVELAGIYSDDEMGQAEPESQAAPKIQQPRRASDAPKAEAAKAAPTREPEGADLEAFGVVVNIESASGTTNNKPWTKHGITLAIGKDETVKFGTFDQKLADAAAQYREEGCEVRVTYTVDSKDRKNLSSIDAVPFEQ